MSQTCHPEVELRKQRERKEKKGVSCGEVDWERVRRNDTLYISSHFDLREWWREMACNQKMHRHLYLALPKILSLPPSNMFLERIFSTCTWFDSHLRQSLADERFEMAVLIAVNDALISGVVPTEDEAKETVENVIATFGK